MIVECTRGFGKVEHPDTGENINVEEPFETDRETYELLNKAYPGFRVVEEQTQTPDESQEEPEEYTCAGNEGECSRTVDEKGGFCWQHE